MALTSYGDISPRIAAYAAKDLLKRALPYLVIEKFGQAKPIPSKNSTSIKFRRYEALSATPNTLTEGVTPTAKQLTATDVTATLVQYGDRVETTDIVIDTHQDPVLRESTAILGEQAAQMLETVRFNILKAGTNVQYVTGATSRATVNAPIDRATQREAVRTLMRQNARRITSYVRSTPDFNTENVLPAYIGLCHTDCINDIRNMTGFVSVENYGTVSPWEGEIGKCEDVRYIASTIFAPFADAGGATSTMLSTSGTNADVYPILYIARDAYGLVPFKGSNAVTPMVVNPKPSDSDPLAQRGHVGWKALHTAAILNDNFMVRAEVAATK